MKDPIIETAIIDGTEYRLIKHGNSWAIRSGSAKQEGCERFFSAYFVDGQIVTGEARAREAWKVLCHRVEK